MRLDSSRRKIESLLSRADIRLNGVRPWDVTVRNDELYGRVLSQGHLGVGEAYMDAWWECRSIDEMVCRIWQSDLPEYMRSLRNATSLLAARFVDLQRGRRAFVVGTRHYDIDTALYQHMLDRRMIYSCGYWKDATTLEQAQEAKLDLVARKLELEPGMKVLDIGCGWGGSLAYLAERYGVEGVGITISERQAAFAKDRHARQGLEFRVQDYRDLDERFDRIFSIGMFEHVGLRNFRRYFRRVRECLAEDGLFLLHTIGGNVSYVRTDPWIERYIFPNSVLPSAKHITVASEGVLVLEDWHSFGTDYDRTLMEWHRNFCAAWPEIRGQFDDRFYRMWNYYLLSCAGTFRARINQLWQIVFSRDGVRGGYSPEGIR